MNYFLINNYDLPHELGMILVVFLWWRFLSWLWGRIVK